MKAVTKLYVKAFLWTGIPFGIFMTVTDILTGKGFKLWNFLFLTFFFGTLMSFTLVSYHIYRLKKRGINNFNDKNLGVNHEKIISSKLNLKELLQKLYSDPAIKLMKIKEIDKGVTITTNETWKSWSEEIKIILNNINGNNFEYLVSSRPKLKTTLVDYGKNLENLNHIENLIRSGT